jgi:hypothetical protein
MAAVRLLSPRSIGADQSQRALDQFRGDAEATQASRGLGVGDDDGQRRQPIIRERQPALDVELEAGERLVVADGCRVVDDFIHRICSRILSAQSFSDSVSIPRIDR